MSKIAIIINSGGDIEQVICSDLNIEVMTVNYDIDGYEGKDVLTIDEDGPAQVGIWAISSDTRALEFLEKGFEMAKTEDL